MTHADAPPREGPPSRYALRFPSSWWHLDLDPHTRDAAIRRRVEASVAEARAAGTPGESGAPETDREQVDALVRMARRTAREAHAQGALQAAGLFQFLSDGSTLSATTVVARTTAPEGASTDLTELLVPVALRNAKNPLGRDAAASSTEIVTLSHAGSAGRVTAVEDIDYYGRATVRTAVRHTVVPVPESRDFLVISSSTPNLGLMNEFFEVFDVISDSLAFQRAS